MTALGGVVRAGVKRRRVQTLVMFLAVTMAVTATVLGGSLVVASNAPFEHAFAAQHGSHLSAQFDASKTTTDQLAASTEVAGVTSAAGPFPTVTVSPSVGDDGDPPPGLPSLPSGFTLPPMTLVGRAEPDGGIDDVDLLSGTWATEPGQVVITEDLEIGSPVGKTLVIPDLPNSPTLTIVGVARSVSATADGWVAPSEIAALTGPGTNAGYELSLIHI